MITRPLNLRAHLRPPASGGFDWTPFFDVVLIAVFFGLFSSRFLFAPGIPLELPALGPASAQALPTAAVLTVRGEGMLLFEGEVLTPERFGPVLQEWVRRRGPPQGALLVKLDRGTRIDTVLGLAEAARAAGFEAVQVAAEPAESPGRPALP